MAHGKALQGAHFPSRLIYGAAARQRLVNL